MKLTTLFCIQVATAELESQLSEAKTRLSTQETETKKIESKLQLSVSEAEKLKTSFSAEKKSWADEKTALTQHAETAEAALKEVTAELTGLKNRVSQMVSAIFGKSPYYLLKVYICHHNVSRLLNSLGKPHRSPEQQSESR